jgi:lysophospholipase L1-like esterase
MIVLPLLVMATQIAGASEFRKPLTELFEADWPRNRTVTIVCHGHSVPAGYFRTPVVQTFDSYPHLLHVAIKQAYPKAVLNVIVTAIGGENSEQGAARFQPDVLSLRPDVVTIDYSLNDRGIGLERAKTAWESMIDSAKKAGIKVILLTPSWDVSVKVDDPNDLLYKHAVQVRELAKKHGVGLADTFDGYVQAMKSGTPMGSLMSQSNHPNRAGHELIVKLLTPWFIGPETPGARAI